MDYKGSLVILQGTVVQGCRVSRAAIAAAGALTAQVAVALLLQCSAAPAAGAHDGGGKATVLAADAPHAPPPGVTLFDLHAVGLASHWTTFLATTPMLNHEPLPQPLQERLAHVVDLYRSLTPADRPAFFVATYFDLLSERLLQRNFDNGTEVLPMQRCPVFVNGVGAPVASLLATASGLPDELFVNAPGKPEHYHELFLQTEYSHCRFLATVQAAHSPPVTSIRPGGRTDVRVSFLAAARPYTAIVGSREEVRALIESVGDVDAVTRFRQRAADPGATVEADVLGFVRLLSLLATQGTSGYAAIPVLAPQLDADPAGGRAVGPLRVADALQLAVQARAAFARIVPYAIRTTDDLLSARFAVRQALSSRGDYPPEHPVTSLLHQFVTGSDLLLGPVMAQTKMPPTSG